MNAIMRKTPSIARFVSRARAIEWPTLALIVACHAVWLSGGMLWAAAPLLSVPLLAITIVLHSSLQHEDDPSSSDPQPALERGAGLAPAWPDRAVSTLSRTAPAAPQRPPR